MRVFITGGTGFIGSAIVQEIISKGHQVLLLSRNFNGPSRSGLKKIKGDLDDLLKWRRKLINFKPDAAIHAAWQGLPDHSAHLSKLNLEFGLNLTELLTEIGCKRLIVIGSGWEYGAQKGKLSESTPPIPFDAFTAAKHSLRWLGGEISKEKNMEFIWTRLFYVYGPGQHPKSLIPYLISCIRSGENPAIRNPNAENDFIYVEDAANAISKILETRSVSNIYNIGSGKLTKVSGIIDLIFKQFNKKNKLKEERKQYKDTLSSSYANISRIKKDTGWRPKTNMKEGVLKTINFYN